MTVIAEAEQVLRTAPVPDVVPHIATVIEPGAILCSSWGYDQTNVDFYMVTRTTKSSAWIVPMSHREQHVSGYAPTAGRATPLKPMETSWVWGPNGEKIETPIKPQMHRIKRYGSTEFLSLGSYANANLWDGRGMYASHYA